MQLFCINNTHINFNLNFCRGCREVLRRRLKTFYLQENLSTSKLQQVESRYRYLLVIDYEATCERENSGFKHEIIEFPVLIVDTELREIVSMNSIYSPAHYLL